MNYKDFVLKVRSTVSYVQETLTLIFLRFKFFFKKSYFNIYDFLNYYIYNTKFLKSIVYLRFQYLFQNPYKLSVSFWKPKIHTHKEEVPFYLFGETPFVTLEKITDFLRLEEEDTFIDLGMGRGEALLWVHFFTKSTVYGLELVPEFVEKLEATVEKHHLKNIHLLQEDFFTYPLAKVSFSNPPCLYCFGSALEENQIEKVIQNCKKFPSGTRIVTVSFPFKDYKGGEDYEILHRFEGSFLWGSADIYIQVKK